MAALVVCAVFLSVADRYRETKRPSLQPRYWTRPKWLRWASRKRLL